MGQQVRWPNLHLNLRQESAHDGEQRGGLAWPQRQPPLLMAMAPQRRTGELRGGGRAQQRREHKATGPRLLRVTPFYGGGRMIEVVRSGLRARRRPKATVGAAAREKMRRCSGLARRCTCGGTYMLQGRQHGHRSHGTEAQQPRGEEPPQTVALQAVVVRGKAAATMGYFLPSPL
ncbi:GHKL domain-containing protein [Sesbania bispinosa]|nr:GHKL domain-containing protein [Sesbania bispinosa]